MRKIFIFAICSIIMLLMAGCGSSIQKTVIKDYIYNQNKIVKIEITKEEERVFVWNIEKTAEIKSFLV